MINFRKVKRQDRDKLYKEVINSFKKNKYSIETIRWASSRYFYQNKHFGKIA